MLLPPHTNCSKRCSACSCQHGKGIDQHQDRHEKSNSCKRCCTNLCHMPNVNPVYNVIQKIHELCDHRWNCQLRQKLRNTSIFHLLRFLLLIHLFSLHSIFIKCIGSLFHFLSFIKPSLPYSIRKYNRETDNRNPYCNSKWRHLSRKNKLPSIPLSLFLHYPDRYLQSAVHILLRSSSNPERDISRQLHYHSFPVECHSEQ